MKKVLLAVILCMVWLPSVCMAKEKETVQWQDSISLDEVQKAFEETQEDAEVGQTDAFSIQEYVTGIVSGTDSFSFRELWQQGISQIDAQFESQKQTLLQILVLGILSGIFLNFAGTIGDKNLSETGFYITFLLLISTMTAGFMEVTEVAMNAIDNLLTFMKALIPSFSLTLCLGLGTGTSVAYYESMLVVIAFLEMLMNDVFIPGVQVYFMLSMINQLADNHFSKLAELVRSFLRFSSRGLFAVLIGYQGIQGMLLPVMDKVKNSTLIQAAKGLPGIGNSLGSVTDTVLGSGMLIKSAVGTGGVLCILVLCFYPLLKLFVFQLMYRVGGALVQPVSDKRIASVLGAAAESGVLLMKFVFAGALMFLLSITIVIVSSNLAM